ncbi:MAG: hypothetical protein ACRDM0_26190, partial [Thermoleophilaceae bacterium]
MKPAANVFVALAGDGASPENQYSMPRKVLAVLAVLMLMLAVPLFWAAPAGSDQPDNAAFVKPPPAGDDDDDEDDDAGGGDDDESKSGDDGTGNGTGTGSNAGTGNDTVGNTDAGGQDTGK